MLSEEAVPQVAEESKIQVVPKPVNPFSLPINGSVIPELWDAASKLAIYQTRKILRNRLRSFLHLPQMNCLFYI